MKTIMLIHGAWHGAWCWYKIVPRLEAGGRRVVALDLPGHGTDRRSVAGLTMHDYADYVVERMLAEEEPVTLVGHSMGGAVISLAAEQAPDAVERLVYLTAFIPRNGQSLFAQSSEDPGTRMAGNVEATEDGACSRILVDRGMPIFYGDCAPEDVALARMLLVPESLAAVGVPLELTDERWGRVPRAYIECTEDQAISIEMQRSMVDRVPCDPVLTLETSHSPFFSAPDALADMLLSL
jgi:pimeloyl-ACP methyl ester carboxylesterase